jgi:hypothetical protein
MVGSDSLRNYKYPMKQVKTGWLQKKNLNRKVIDLARLSEKVKSRKM